MVVNVAQNGERVPVSGLVSPVNVSIPYSDGGKRPPVRESERERVRKRERERKDYPPPGRSPTPAEARALP